MHLTQGFVELLTCFENLLLSISHVDFMSFIITSECTLRNDAAEPKNIIKTPKITIINEPRSEKLEFPYSEYDGYVEAIPKTMRIAPIIHQSTV